MTEYIGKSVYKEIAVGKIRIFKHGDLNIQCVSVSDAEAEMNRFNQAKQIALDQLEQLYNNVVSDVGSENAAIFNIHAMMLEDESYTDIIENVILHNRLNAEYAVSSAMHSFCEMFRQMDDPYMQARSADVCDVSERLLSILKGSAECPIFSDEPAVIIADNLSPSETVRLAKGNIIAFATVSGSANSHTAILAKTMKLPALVGVNIELSSAIDGHTALIDGFEGRIYIDPEDGLLEKLRCRHEEEAKKAPSLLKYKGRENITLDGRTIRINANIGSIEEITDAIANDAGGIGLFRSEPFYLARDRFPTEDELFEFYSTAVKLMDGKETVIRVLDVGDDKQVNYYGLPEEKNPALGCRGIRYLLKRPEIFRTQLRAIYRAAAFGNASVLYPMVSSYADVGRIRRINCEVMSGLESEGITFGNVRQGYLIETPSAVMISDLIAREADFLSIGTNDLAQYTMAADRENSAIDEFFDPFNISLFRMIKMIIDNAHRYKKQIGICGEIAADLSLTEIFLSMGIDELSVTPSEILPLRKKVCGTDIEKNCQDVMKLLWV